MFGIDLWDASLAPALLVAAAAGVLSFLSPCVLPIVPAYLAFVAGTSLGEATGGRIVRAAVFFVLGLSTVFLLLGAVTLLGEPRNHHRLVLGALALLAGLACEPRFVPFVPWVLLAVRWTGTRPSRGGLGVDLALLAAGVLGWVDPFEPLRAVDAPAAIAGVLALWTWPVALTPTHGGFSCARSLGCAPTGLPTNATTSSSQPFCE